ncbi:MAG: PepSY domain-containing protein, partial [Eubacterium sp.]|nr:PepSY domain-containing protein [Eubacterium sp.]
ALKDSNLSEKDVVFTKAKLEMEIGIYVYEFEFETSTTEFEYEINALTGKIVDKSSEPVD